MTAGGVLGLLQPTEARGWQIGHMSAFETGQMSAVKQISATVRLLRCCNTVDPPCFISSSLSFTAADIGFVSAAYICPVSTKEIESVSKKSSLCPEQRSVLRQHVRGLNCSHITVSKSQMGPHESRGPNLREECKNQPLPKELLEHIQLGP